MKEKLGAVGSRDSPRTILHTPVWIGSRRGGTNLTVKIVTDSTASIPVDLREALNITVIPLTIHFDSDTYVDGVDPLPEFYARLEHAAHAPTTSTPSPGVFLDAYRRLSTDGSTIISLHLMGSKSSLINTARMAANMLPDSAIHVIDSETTTLGLGLLVITAARAAQAGQAAGDILSTLAQLIPRVDVHVVIRDLTQLRRSGRVSLGQALVAGMLSIKPILYVGRGIIEVADRVRSWPRALERMAELAHAKVGGTRISLAVVHTSAELEAHQLMAAIQNRFRCEEAFVAEAGTALATHAGPGAVGIVTLKQEA